MKKLFSFLFLLGFSCFVQAKPDFSTTFKGTEGCFILFDLNQNKRIAEYNPSHCKEKIPANSTFKIPLSLIAFNENLIHQKTIFKWDGQPKGPEELGWNQDQTPKTWLKNSTVWVSQELAPKIGMDKMKDYLKKFHYGNEDFSDGLTTAWLSSSLKISPEEQLEFLKNMVTYKLPVSKQAIENTEENLLIESTPNGAKLFGKTGSGNSLYKDGRLKKGLQDGWFMGYLKKGKETYLFVLDFSDKTVAPGLEPGGLRARTMVKSLLAQMGFF